MLSLSNNRFLLNQHYLLDFDSVSPLTQQSTGRHLLPSSIYSFELSIWYLYAFLKPTIFLLKCLYHAREVSGHINMI